jgi:hypothetical protein
VTVTNTTANPVPVTGGVEVTNTPTVKFDSSANTVKIDPNINTVKLAPSSSVSINQREPYMALRVSEWSGKDYISFPNLNNGVAFTEARICFENNSTHGVSVWIYSWIGESGAGTRDFVIDHFKIPYGGDVCNVYDAPGNNVEVRTFSDDDSGRIWVGFLGIY